jgi:hypothetical protein
MIERLELSASGNRLHTDVLKHVFGEVIIVADTIGVRRQCSLLAEQLLGNLFGSEYGL